MMLAVYAQRLVANGTVSLRDASNATIASVTITGGAAWYTTTFDALAASSGKLDLFAQAGVTLNVFAASLFRYAS